MQETARQSGTLAFYPVFTNDHQNLAGFAVCVLRLQSALERALGSTASPHIEVMLLDITDNKDPKFLAGYPTQTQNISKEFNLQQRDYHSVQPLFFFDRSWAVVISPRASFWTVERGWAGLTMGFAGLLITLLMTIFVGFMRNRQSALEREVQKQTQELRRSKERFDQIAEHAREIIWEIDPQGRFTYVSHVAEMLLGYNFAELREKKFYDLHPESGRERFKRIISKTMEKKEIVRDLKHPVQTKGGQIVWMLTNGIPLTDSTGRLTGYRGSSADVSDREQVEQELKVYRENLEGMIQSRTVELQKEISERKKTETVLRESERQYRSLFSNMLGGFAHCRMLFENGQPTDFVYLDVNDAFGKITGLQNVIGKNVSEVIPGIKELSPDLFEIYGRVALTGKAEKFEYYFEPLKSWLAISVYSVQKDNFTVVFENITEQKRAAVALQESEQRFMDVLYASSDAILLIDGDKFIDCNHTTARMLGYADRTEFLMTHPSQLSPSIQPDGQKSYEKANDMIKTAFERGFHRFEWIHRRANGEDFPVEVSLTPIVHQGKTILHCLWRDLTEKKRSEEALRESESQWQSLVREAPARISMLDRSGRIMYTNRPNQDGWSGHDVGHLATESLDIIETKKFQESLDKVFESMGSITYQSRHVLEDGFEQWCENHLGPIQGKDGVKAAIWITFDITERKRVEENFRKLSQAVEQSPVSVIITNYRGEIEYVNPCFTSTSGYSFEDVYGQNARVLKSGDHSVEFYRNIWEAVSSGKRWVGEIHNRRKTGELYWESVHISPIVDSTGRVTHFVAIKEDVDARKKIEEELRQSRKRLHEFINAVPNPIYFKNAQGIYEDCNTAFAQSLGLTLSEIIGRSVFDIIPSDRAESFHKADVKLVDKKLDNQAFETKLKFSDGKDHDVIIHKAVLKNSDGTLRGIVGSLIDITDHKRLEEDLHNNEAQLIAALEEVKMFNLQLEQAQGQLVQQEKLAAIGFLAAGVAHEINNPLGFVHGNLSALEEYADAFLKMISFIGPMSEAVNSSNFVKAKEIGLEAQEATEKLELDYIVGDVKKLIGETEQGLDRIKKIVQGLRSFSRSDGGEMVMANINDLIDGVVNIVWNEIKYKAELVKEYGDVPLVRCNPQQLGQVFMNILVNAAQAIPVKGSITIRTFLKNDEIVSEIVDTGAGISDEIKTKIFDPFFTTKEPGQGTGLGLSISYDIVKKHNGRIDVDSKVGNGTKFSLYLPVSRPEEKV